MAQETAQEKTEEATPKRLRESKEKGQVARSRELNTLALLLTASAGIFMFGSGILQSIVDVFHMGMMPEREAIFDESVLLEYLILAIQSALIGLAPLFMILFFMALLASAAIGGVALTPLKFKWDKMDPIKGIKRLFGVSTLMELIKAMFKFFLVISAVSLLIWSWSDSFMMLGQKSIDVALSDISGLLILAFSMVSAALIIIVIVDVPFQIWNHQRQLKMTMQEVKDERKETDGNPELKARIRTVQREISQRRMMAEVPKADVIITNPTHYAVALRYDQQRMKSPIVVARGADLIAEHIRTIAIGHNVTIVSAPPLARAIYFNIKINEPIPDGLYLAVAQVLAYVWELRLQMKKSYAAVKTMDDLPIPDELRHE